MAQDDPYAAYAVPVRSGPSVKERSTEAQIGSSEASAASSRASAERTRAITPVDIARTASQTATEEATRPAAVRKGEAEADIAELRAQQLRMALDKAAKQGGARPQGKEAEEAEAALLAVIKAGVRAKQLSAEQFGASGFGSSFMQNFGGTAATTVRGLLDTIGGNIAFDRLQKMRAESPTNGALGNVTERELDMLKSSVAPIGQGMADTDFQAGLDDVIRSYINVYGKIGGDPYKLAEVLGPTNFEQFSDLITAWRPLPEDEQLLTQYVNQARADGTFSPADYAAYMAQAYTRATGRKPERDFVERAVDEGLSLGQSADPVGGFDFTPADAETRRKAAEYAGAAAPTETGWGEAIGGGLMMLPESTADLAADTVRALTLELPDTIDGVVKIVGGATGLSENTEAWDAVKAYYTDRYGSAEGFKYALKTDPAAVLADIAGLATGGATLAAKGLSTAGRVGRVAALSSAARGAENLAELAAKVDPLTRGIGVGIAGARTVGRGLGNVATTVPAKIAGVSGAEVRQAVSAGRRGSQDFLGQLQQTAPVAEPVAKMEGAIGELYARRSADYQRRMARMDKTEALDFSDVDAAINDVRDVGRHKGIDISAAAGVWDQVDALVDQFRSQGFNTIEDFDAMKRAVGNIRDGYQRGTPEYKVAQDVYQSINGTITAKAPVYANIMKDYRAASDALSDIQASLSSNSASADTILNRLRRTAAGGGPRGTTVLDILEGTKSGKGIGDAIAGAALSGTEPSGLTSSLSPVAAAATQSPEMLATMALTPRTVGERAYNVGQAIGTGERALQGVRSLPPVAAAEAKLADLNQKYGAGAASVLRVANPTLIQPQADPFAFPAASFDRDYAASVLAAPPYVGVPTMPKAEEQPNLNELRARYGAAPSEGAVTPDLAALGQRYAGEKAASAPVISVGGRRVQLDPSTDEYVDLDTGERAKDVADFAAGFKRGGFVAVPTFAKGGRVRKSFARALKG